MTKEESITMWNIEKNSADSSTFTKKMKKLFSKVEELIMSGELMYDQFSGDMLDAVTDMIIDNTNKGATLDRADQIDYLCDKLYEKYTQQYNNSESGKEIAQFQKILQKYKNNSEYVNPNVPQKLAESILQRLSKEYYLGYRID